MLFLSLLFITSISSGSAMAQCGNVMRLKFGNLEFWIALMWQFFFWLHMWTCDIPPWKFNLGFIMQFEPAPRRGEPDVTRRTPDYFLWVICCTILIIGQDCNSGCWSVTFLLDPYDKVTWPAIARKCRCLNSVRIDLHSWLQEVLSTYHPNRRENLVVNWRLCWLCWPLALQR